MQAPQEHHVCLEYWFNPLNPKSDQQISPNL